MPTVKIFRLISYEGPLEAARQLLKISYEGPLEAVHQLLKTGLHGSVVITPSNQTVEVKVTGTTLLGDYTDLQKTAICRELQG